MDMEEEWISPEEAPIRIVEIVATVSYLKKGYMVVETFTDVKEAERFFNNIKGRAKLVVKDPQESWKCIKEK